MECIGDRSMVGAHKGTVTKLGVSMCIIYCVVPLCSWLSINYYTRNSDYNVGEKWQAKH